MIDAETLIEDNYSVWKVVTFLYLLIIFAFFLDISNTSFLFSPSHFSFVPVLLFIGAVKFPKLMLYGVAFCFGLLTDILSYTPIGLMGALYLFTVVLCRWQYRFILAQPFHVIWMFFTVYWTVFCTVVILIQSLYARYIFGLSSELVVFLYGVFLFPLSWILLQKAKSFFVDTDMNLS